VEICLQPIGNVDKKIIEFLKINLGKVFGKCRILKIMEVPNEAYNSRRNQYNSSIILMKLPKICEIVLGVTEVDIFAYTFNFIFGEAELNGKRAVISLARLNPEFYGEDYDENLLKIRTLKESMHEIGHVLGLFHCKNKKCVMSFSNTILDTDYKDWRYCSKCLEKLKGEGINLNLLENPNGLND